MTAPAVPTSVDLLHSGARLFRSHLSGPAWIYYAATAPFIIGLADFISSLSSGIILPGEISRRALALTALYTLKSAGQAWYCRIAAVRMRNPEADVAARDALRGALLASILHGVMLPLNIVSMIFCVPFGVTCSMSQFQLVLATRPGMDVRGLWQASWREAIRDIGVQHKLWSWIAILYVVVFINLYVLFNFIPEMLKSFFDIDTIFSLSPLAAFNTTFFTLVFGFTYLCVDPIVKLSFVALDDWRTTRKTGEDIIWKLDRRIAAAAAGMILLMAAPVQADVFQKIQQGPEDTAADLSGYYRPLLKSAREELGRSRDTAELNWIRALISEDTLYPEDARFIKKRCAHLMGGSDTVARAVDTGAFQDALKQTFTSDRYRWRVRYQAEPDSEYTGVFAPLVRMLKRPIEACRVWVHKANKKISEWMKKAFEKIFSRKPSKTIQPPSSVPHYLETALLTLIIVLVLALTMMILRQRRRALPSTPDAPAEPDLRAEEIDARVKNREEWLALSEELASGREFTLALRAVFLATLSKLAELRLIQYEPYKTNYEYISELARLARAAEQPGLFSDMVRRFELAWYGRRDVTADHYEQFKALNLALTGGSHAT